MTTIGKRLLDRLFPPNSTPCLPTEPTAQHDVTLVGEVHLHGNASTSELRVYREVLAESLCCETPKAYTSALVSISENKELVTGGCRLGRHFGRQISPHDPKNTTTNCTFHSFAGLRLHYIMYPSCRISHPSEPSSRIDNGYAAPEGRHSYAPIARL